VRARQQVLGRSTDPLERVLESGHAEPKKSLSSRDADSCESDPCTMFSVITVA
jgi:hypothetical protein